MLIAWHMAYLFGNLNKYVSFDSLDDIIFQTIYGAMEAIRETQ